MCFSSLHFSVTWHPQAITGDANLHPLVKVVFFRFAHCTVIFPFPCPILWKELLSLAYTKGRCNWSSALLTIEICSVRKFYCFTMFVYLFNHIEPCICFLLCVIIQCSVIYHSAQILPALAIRRFVYWKCFFKILIVHQTKLWKSWSLSLGPSHILSESLSSTTSAIIQSNCKSAPSYNLLTLFLKICFILLFLNCIWYTILYLF